MNERGQATIEALAIVPVCLLAACTLVEAGIVLREQIMASQAAGRAAVAHIERRDPAEAARAALGARRGQGVSVRVDGDSVTVRVRSSAQILGLAGIGRLSSTASFATAEGGAR